MGDEGVRPVVRDMGDQCQVRCAALAQRGLPEGDLPVTVKHEGDERLVRLAEMTDGSVDVAMIDVQVGEVVVRDNQGGNAVLRPRCGRRIDELARDRQRAVVVGQRRTGAGVARQGNGLSGHGFPQGQGHVAGRRAARRRRGDLLVHDGASCRLRPFALTGCLRNRVIE
ncbi:hypothetical protein C6P97_07350 [Burkholderia multivorans]|uniref:Uncharacterized protein n=1 Tax=Burkholderia multivorans TaxID=87883 RepID=A0AB37ASD2_9BURK|nr:hypothetical protein C6P99_19135 [Burkholderia multivorans]PRE52107.1 hypothetical protein C6P97_07350 [Burkholderia multivorans]